MTIPTSLAGNHTLVALPFAAGSLNGLSERMISSHHENNYGGAVKNLNRAEHWDEVNRRLDRAQRMSAILRGAAG